MVFRITQAVNDPRTLTQAVLQVTTLLDMFQAELAQLFVRFYKGLYERMNGDGVAMRHWLRVENQALGGVPHLLIVDENRLAELVRHVERDKRR